MDKTTIRWIVAGAVTVALLVCGTVLLMHGPATVQEQLVAGLAYVGAVLGAALTWALRRDANANGRPDWLDWLSSLFDSGDDDDDDDHDDPPAVGGSLRPPPSGSTPADAARRAFLRDTRADRSIGLLFVAAVLLTIVQGCGASALQLQSDAALVTSRTFAAADRVMVETRGAELDAESIALAERTCDPEAGCNEAQRAALTERFRAAEQAWAPSMACRAPVFEGLRSWLDGIEDAHTASSEELGWMTAVAWGARALRIWDAFVGCVTANLPDGSDLDLPTLPALVRDLVNGVAR